MKKRIISVILTLCMVLMLLPAPVFATDGYTVADAHDYSGVYDGEEHSITLNYDSSIFTAKYSIDGGASWQDDNPRFKDAGSYTVQVNILKGGEFVESCSATVTITAADVSDQVVFNNESFYTYTGSPVDFAPSFEGIDNWSYVYLENGEALDAPPTAVGNYSVEMTGEGANYYARITYSYSIIAAEMQYTADGYTGVYDGEAHSITVSVATEGALVTYTTSMDSAYTESNPTFVDAGEYPVWFMIEKDNYANVGSCRFVTITKRDVSEQVSFERQDIYAYTGSPVVFSPTCDGITEWNFQYSANDGTVLETAPSAPGEYTVSITGEGTNCFAQIEHTYRIVQEEIEYTAGGYSGAYDGKEHSITVDVATSGVTVMYSMSAEGGFSTEKPTFKDAGTYTVYFRLEKENCETVGSSATVTITKRDVSEQVSFEGQTRYAYTGSPVVFSPACDGIPDSAWTLTYFDRNGTKLAAAPSDPGNYIVEMTGEGANCFAKVRHSYSIVNVTEEIKYTASGYSGEYDGKAHSIELDVVTDDVTVMYSMSDNGEFSTEKPTFKDAGTYTVFFRLEKEFCKTEKGSATVEITKATPQLYFEPGNIVFKPGEKSRQLEWVYNGDGKLHFTSSDSRHFWVDPSGGLVSLNQEGGVSIWVTASETRNCKSVTAMCIVETESTLPQIDIDTKLEYTNTASDLLQQEAKKISSGKGDLILYLDAKLIDPRDPEQKKELHNVRASFNVPYNKILKEDSKPAAAYDFAVLHQRIDNEIEKVPFIPRANGLQICDTTFSPFAIVYFPKENYNLYYNVNGGTGTPLNQSVPMYGESYSVTVSSDLPRRDGYIFKGWSTGSAGEVQYMPGDTITLDRDIVLYAVWSENTNTYTVKFNTDGGNTILDKYVHWSDSVLDGIPAPTKDGWEFIGWKCGDSPVAENTTYGGLAANDTTTSITLVAQWKDITVPVISGIENGETYCAAQTVTVSDNDSIASITVNGTSVTLDENNQFTLSPAEGEQKIVATDKAGNVSAEMIVTVNDGHTDANTDHVCDICGATLSGHTGGKATCISKAICEYCGEAYGEVDSSNHNLESIPATAATVTETGNKAYWHCKDCGKYFSDQDGKNSIALKDTVTQKLQPEIIEGTGQSLTAGEKKDFTFRSNAAFSDFIRVELDGKTLDEKNYTAKEGSTVVTLKADYVGTLSAGEHTIGIVSTNGTATTTFTVNAKAVVDNDTKSPQTGDNSHMVLWIALLFVSGAGVIGTTVYGKKKRAK